MRKEKLHMLFLGNPGTGKTTVARVIGQIFKQEGILRKGLFYEKTGNDFVTRYVGTSKGSTADETVPVLVAEMENHRNDLCVILAGYKDELIEIFIKMVKKNFTYEDTLMEAVAEYINNIPKEQYESKEFSNARFVRNLYEHLWGKAAYRMSLSGETDIVLKKEDWVNVMAEENFNAMVEEKPKRIIGF